MTEKQKKYFDFGVLIGILIIVAGGLLLLQNFGVISNQFWSVWDFWPLILVAIGISKLFQPKEFRQPIIGLLFLGFGVVFLLDELFPRFYFNWDDMWPFLIILIGLVIVRNSIWKPRHHHGKCGDEEGSHFLKDEKKGMGHFGKASTQDGDFINLSFVMSGGNYRYNSKNLKGGKISAIMGGAEINLREADIDGDSMTIEVFALMGGVDLWVPETWTVINHMTPILGGVEDKTVPPAKRGKELIIHGTAIMGGIEVKN